MPHEPTLSSLQIDWITYTGMESINDLAFDQNDDLWAATDEGVIKLDTANGEYTQYTRADGLPERSVFCVAIAPDNTPWVGTAAGVSHFDGKKWVTYTVEDGLAGDQVKAAAIAPDGTLWFGTHSGVSRFDSTAASGEAWTTYTTADGLVGNRVVDIFIAPDGALWLGTPGGVSRFDGETSSEAWISYALDLAGDTINALALTPDGTVWVATGNEGVYRLDQKAASGKAWTAYTEKDGLISNYGISIAIAPDGALWFGTHGGVSRFDGQRWITYNRDLPQEWIATIAAAGDGTMWIGTKGGIIARLNGSTSTWIPCLTINEGLPHNYITSIVTAPDGTTWVGTCSGLIHFGGTTAPHQVRAVYFGRNLGQNLENYYHDTHCTTKIASIAIGPDGAVWAGFEVCGTVASASSYMSCLSYGGSEFLIARFYDERWFEYVPDILLEESGEDTIDARAIAATSSGTVWIGTQFGLLRFADEKWTLCAGKDGLPDASVSSIAVASGGAVWIGTTEGVFHFDTSGSDEAWTAYTTADGLADNAVTAIAVASDAAVWVGTENGGVSRFDGEEWITYTVADGLASNRITSIAPAPDGIVWIGTKDSGVSRLDSTMTSSRGWATYTIADGLADNAVTAIAVAPDGSVWIGTDNGLSVYQP